MDSTIMTLQQHFCNTCRTAEIAIYLEGGMSVKEIGIGSTIRIFPHLTVVGQQVKHIG